MFDAANPSWGLLDQREHVAALLAVLAQDVARGPDNRTADFVRTIWKRLESLLDEERAIDDYVNGEDTLV